MDFKKLKSKLSASLDLLTGSSKYTYAQFGEDILMDTLFTQTLQINRPTYLDIGANNPKGGSNTYLFYLKGCYGVCVEPDINLYNKIRAVRPNDRNINAGVGNGELKEAVFYYFPQPYTGWNTFSREEALLKQEKSGVQFKNDKIIPFISINTIIQENFEDCPDLVSIDVEGLDLEILKSLDFDKYKPAVFCVETMEFNSKNMGRKNEQIIRFMAEKGYVVYADTYINSIFARKDLMEAQCS